MKNRYGLNIVGGAFTEDILLRVAFTIEQKTRVRERGKHFILPTVDLADIVKERDRQQSKF
jgi:hypothetical protein